MRFTFATIGVIAISLFGIQSSHSQSATPWDATPQNIQVLPKDFSGQRLRPVMMGFTRALGVRCSHCHVGEEGQPLSTFDFVSDDNPNKDRAREMLRMLGSVNDHLDKIETSGPEPANMWCHTCHHGTPRPMRLSEQLVETWRADGAVAAVDQYHALRERYYGRGAYDFGEPSLSQAGGAMLEAGDFDGAIALLSINQSHFPDSANAWLNLGAAYSSAGRNEQAIAAYEAALVIDPENEAATTRLDELRER